MATESEKLPGPPLVIGGGFVVAAWIVWANREFLPRLLGLAPQAAAQLGSGLRWGALACLLAGAAVLFVAWRRFRRAHPQPIEKGAWKYVALPGGVILAIVLIQSSRTVAVASIAMLLPLVLAGAAVSVLMKTKRAARWSQTTARITVSELREHRIAHRGEPERVTNVPWLEYEFTAGGRTVTGHRVAFGGPAGGPAQVLGRYPAGASVPVFYDPADPGESVLERDMPVAAGWIWALVVTALAIGIAVTFAILGLDTVDQTLARILPAGAQPILTIVFLGGGLLMMALLVGQLRQAGAAARWPTAVGRVVTSTVTSFDRWVGRGQRTTRVFQALVDYAYTVDGREYHGSRLRIGEAEGESEARAKAQAARYPGGAAVSVRYDPKDPARAVLELGIAPTVWLSAGLTVVLLVLGLRFSALLG